MVTVRHDVDGYGKHYGEDNDGSNPSTRLLALSLLGGLGCFLGY